MVWDAKTKWNCKLVNVSELVVIGLKREVTKIYDGKSGQKGKTKMTVNGEFSR